MEDSKGFLIGVVVFIVIMIQFPILFVLFLIAIFVIIAILLADERRKKEEQRARDLVKQKDAAIWEAHLKTVPWRYLDDADSIVRSWDNFIHPGPRSSDDEPLHQYDDVVIKIDTGFDGCHRKIRVWLRNHPGANDELVLDIQPGNFKEYGCPAVYRPQGSVKWEDRLIYLSEHMDEIIEEHKEKAEETKRQIWKHNHSPLP